MEADARRTRRSHALASQDAELSRGGSVPHSCACDGQGTAVASRSLGAPRQRRRILHMIRRDVLDYLDTMAQGLDLPLYLALLHQVKRDIQARIQRAHREGPE